MRRVPILALCWLVFFTSLAQASGEYTIHKGDTLWKISHDLLGKGSLYPKIQKENVGKADRPRRLKIGTVLIIPGVPKATEASVAAPGVNPVDAAAVTSGVKEAEVSVVAPVVKPVAATAKAPRAKDSETKKPVKNAPKPERKASSGKKTGANKAKDSEAKLSKKNPSIYDDAHVGRDPWRGHTELAYKLLGIQIPKGAKVTLGDRGTEEIPNGEIIRMISGANKVGDYEVGLSSGSLKVLKYALFINGVEQSQSVYINPACKNWLIWNKKPEPPVAVEPPPPPVADEPPPVVEDIPPVVTEDVPPEETVVIETKKHCNPELEATVGAYVYMHVPPGNEGNKSTGNGAYGEVMFWENCRGDCSSEYSWGVGAIGSIYNYAINDLPSEGDGWRAAGEVGLKRNWERNALNQSWQTKVRLGWERGDWENSQTGKSITQEGPVYGVYAEYVRELQRNKLWWVTQAEGWAGFSQSIDGPAEWNLEPESRTQVQVLTGLDYRFAPRWTLRGQLGLGWQEYNGEGFIPWNAQVMYDLPNKNGRFAFGPYGQHYFSAGDSIGSFVRYETGDLIRKWDGDRRAGEHHYTAEKGIAYGKTPDDLKKSEVAAVPYGKDSLEELFPKGND